MNLAHAMALWLWFVYPFKASILLKTLQFRTLLSLRCCATFPNAIFAAIPMPMFGRIGVFRAIVFCLLFSSSASLLAQDAKLDSMLKVYRTGKFTPELLNDLCWAYVFNQPDSAIYYGKKAVKLAQKEKDLSSEAKAFNRMGVAFDIKHLSDSALLYYHNAVYLSKKGGDAKTTAGALNNIGLIQWNLGELEKAVNYYVQSATLFEKLNDQKGLANTYNNIGLVLWEDRNYKEGLAYSLKALHLRLALKDNYGIAASYGNIGLIYDDLGQRDSAARYLNLAIPLKLQLKDDYGLAKCYHNLGSLYQKQKKYDEAIQQFELALEISTRLGNNRSSASTLFYMGAVKRRQKDSAKALECLNKAASIVDPKEDAKLYWKILYEKALVNRDQGNFQEATRLLLRMDIMKDSLLNLERSEALEELELKYRTVVKDKQLHEQERMVAETSLLAERRNRYIIILISALIILALFGLFYFQHTKRKAQAERDAAIIVEREMGIRAVLLATEEERKRIAKDLHDGVVQGLTGLKLRLQNQLRKLSALPTEQEVEFKETASMLDASIDEVRTISHRMMPRALSELGLVPAMADLLDKTLGQANIQFQFEHHKVEVIRFDETVEVSLYRIAQELITNIIKHAQAQAVSVQLLKTASHLVLVVEDNGKGFAYEDQTNRNGIGLMNISSRAKALHGEVTYVPSPLQGTVATIRIPLA